MLGQRGEGRMQDLRLPTPTLPWVALLALQTVGLLLSASLVFDVIHYVLHQFARSRFGFLRAIGALPETHHRFFDRQLRFDDALARKNLREHVIPEFLTRTAVVLAGLRGCDPLAVAIVFAIQAVQLFLVLRLNGRDANHVAFDTLSAPPRALIV